MKKVFLNLLFLFVISFSSASQPLDTSTIIRIMDKGNKQIVTAITGQTKELKDSIGAALSQGKIAPIKVNKTVADVITFLPVILFIIILFVISVKLKRDNVKLSDFLNDKDVQVAIKKEEGNIEVTKLNAVIATANAIKANAPAFIAANVVPPEISINTTNTTNTSGDGQTGNQKEQSTSRLIVFISGLTSMALAVCIAAFYFYRSFLGESNVNIGNLSTVLYGLGLGIIPYGFNKIANALK